MKKQFDIKYRPQIESGEYKVVTKRGQEVRIVCWDMNTSNGTLLVALVKGFGGEYEKMRSYTLDGKCKSASEDASILVITPEPELTEFEEHVQAVMMNSGLVGCTECYKDTDTVKTTAKSLLEYAKKELQPKYNATKVDKGLIDNMVTLWKNRFKENENSVLYIEEDAYRMGLADMYKQFAAELDEAFKNQDEVVYNRGYDKGNSDALKDLPHWTPFTALNGIYDYQHRLVWNGYKIDIDELFTKLPKEE